MAGSGPRHIIGCFPTKYGVVVKDYRNARTIYTPSEMVGTQRTGIRGIGYGDNHEWPANPGNRVGDRCAGVALVTWIAK